MAVREWLAELLHRTVCQDGGFAVPAGWTIKDHDPAWRTSPCNAVAGRMLLRATEPD